MLLRFIFFVYLFLPLLIYSYTGPYYVATNGSDTNNGSYTNPFATIQKAIDIMSAGPPVCSKATCYIGAGVYTQSIIIKSNKNSGDIVITALSNDDPPVLEGGNSLGTGIIISNTGYIKISHLIIRNYTNYGILLNGTATNNIITDNSIYSNKIYGIFVIGEAADNNYISDNNIWGNNQNTGIYVTNSDFNSIFSNTIYIHNYAGVVITGNSVSNYLKANTIYSNSQTGIIIGAGGAVYNYLSKNYIYGTNQDIGIAIYSGGNTINSNWVYENSTGLIINSSSNYIKGNQIYLNNYYGTKISGNNNYIDNNKFYGTNQLSGIFVSNSINSTISENYFYNNKYGIYLINATNSYITKNNIYSNEYAGIYFTNNNNTFILTNEIWGELQNTGIKIIDSSSNRIYRNLIRENRFYGIFCAGNSSGVEIINNTIFYSILNDGIYWTNSAAGKVINNIILSNNNYGIRNTGSGSIFVAYNDIYGNSEGMTNGLILWGNGNIAEDPMIETVSSFTITMVISPVVDTASNIIGVTKTTNSDMGWKEYPSDLTAPTTAPVIFKVKALNCCEMIITWKDLTNESSYTLFRSTINDTNTAVPIAGLSYNQTNYHDVSLVSNTTYYYWVKAYNRLGASPFSTVRYDTTKSIYYPLSFKVFPTYFNPKINGKAKIFLTDDKPTVRIKIYDLVGNIVRQWNEEISGVKFVEWDGKDDDGNELEPGVYIIHITGDEIDERIKMILTR